MLLIHFSLTHRSLIHRCQVNPCLEHSGRAVFGLSRCSIWVCRPRYPDIRISRYPDIRISRYPDIQLSQTSAVVVSLLYSRIYMYTIP
jgi:hypothetical protein